MSIAKAKANAIAITHRSVVGREPQTAILYSTPLGPPLILNCERFFLYENKLPETGTNIFLNYNDSEVQNLNLIADIRHRRSYLIQDLLNRGKQVC